MDVHRWYILVATVETTVLILPRTPLAKVFKFLQVQYIISCQTSTIKKKGRGTSIISLAKVSVTNGNQYTSWQGCNSRERKGKRTCQGGKAISEEQRAKGTTCTLTSQQHWEKTLSTKSTQVHWGHQPATCKQLCSHYTVGNKGFQANTCSASNENMPYVEFG